MFRPDARDAEDERMIMKVFITTTVGFEVDHLLRKLKRSGFLPQAAPDAEALAREADDRLSKSILLDPNHV